MSKKSRDSNNFLAFGAPLIGESEIEEVVEVLRSGWLGTGPRVARFEEMFKKSNLSYLSPIDLLMILEN